MATKQTRLTPFGRKVRKRLIDKNMTQVELAALLGCNHADDEVRERACP